MSSSEVTLAEIESLKLILGNDAVDGMIVSGSLKVSEPPQEQLHNDQPQVPPATQKVNYQDGRIAQPVASSSDSHSERPQVTGPQPSSYDLPTETVVRTEKPSSIAAHNPRVQESRKRPRSSAPTSGAMSPLGSSLQNPLSGSNSRGISSGKARRGGVIRGTKLRPSRGYIAQIPSTRSQPERSHAKRVLRDLYRVPDEDDDFVADHAFSMVPSQPNSTPNISQPPRRGTRQRSVLPGAYTTPNEDVDEKTFVPSPLALSFPSEVTQPATSTSRTKVPSKATTKLAANHSQRPSTSTNIDRPSTEHDGSDAETDTETIAVQLPPPRRQFLVGVDYGSTFTSISYAVSPITQQQPHLEPQDVKSIRNWPHVGSGGSREQVPTELWYSSTPIAREIADGSDSSDFGGPGEEEDEEGSEEGATRQSSPDPPNSAHQASGSNSWSTVNQSKSVLTIADTSSSSSDGLLWGYQAQHKVYRSKAQRNMMRRVERPKLMLLSSQHTEGDRQRLLPRLSYLIKHGCIRKYSKADEIEMRDVQDPIADFLTKVFAHTKQQLIELEDFTEDCPVTFALAIPIIWSPASSRIMQTCMEAAIKASSFGTLSHGSVDNLFIVSEPEAGATFAMASSRRMLGGEAFIFADCGGGTVDVVTYSVTNGTPLRLKSEVGNPTGDNCGASYLNDNYERLLLSKLSEETYLTHNGETLQDIVRLALQDFEDYQKREVDIHRHPTGEVHIRGLLANPSKRFDQNCLYLDKDDYDLIFLPLLNRVENLLRGQLEDAIEQDKEVKASLYTSCTASSYWPLTHSRNVVAVSSGAVLRVSNLEKGPRRRAFSNFGFLRGEHYQPEIEEGHQEATPHVNSLDGQRYVDVIHYFMLKNEILDTVHTFPPLECTHKIPAKRKELLCREILYVNDSDTASSYPPDHPINIDKQEVGRIVVDMSFLKDEGRITPIVPVPDVSGKIRKPHYEIIYDLVVTVEARNLRYEARYPAGQDGQTLKYGTGQISIAAAFKPGTG
ncbi:uncharacterized protein PAC_14946 [Phialocephala subalpina]|uniref:Hsp70 protein n=1 Tax=Phialocephala subalpina TaxID=576137 RepID=A0A1L7XJD1_9HELO|nr:uncharacterized protein PAC_14946 [Phialocephala subalpina]